MKFFSFRVFIAVGILLFPSASFASKDTIAKQAMIVDGVTGQVLLSKDGKTKMPTSSMSKVMTMYMVFDALKKGSVKLDSELPVSEKAWRKGGSKMFVEVNKKVKVEDLIRGVIVQSGNDATIVLAEGLAGDEESFAIKMTEKAKELGMENSSFKNASGWPDPDHYSTAEDLITLSRRISTDFPEYYKYYSEKKFKYNDIEQSNRNPLLFQDIGADGLKTGHTEIGGYGLMGTAVKDGRRVYMVLNGMESEKDRAQESKRLMLWALNSFVNVKAVEANQELEKIDIAFGQEEQVAVIASNDLSITVPRLTPDKFDVSIAYDKEFEAPIKAGQKLGVLTISAPNMEDVTQDVVAAQDVERKGFFGVTIDKLKLFVKSLLDKV